MNLIQRAGSTIVLATALSTTAFAGLADVPSGSYELEDTHAYINFTYSHLGFSNPVVGFDEFDVALTLDTDDVTKSTLAVSVDPASIDSQVEKFDNHLKGDDMFDVAKFPTITFEATSITSTGDSTMDITGDLTMKGITKPITLNATINKAGTHPFSKKPTVGVSASAKLMRKDWDLGYAVPAVGNEVTLNIQVELVKAGDAS
ncbi:MAG: YceI family protein [Pseudomonadota bacterium]